MKAIALTTLLLAGTSALAADPSVSVYKLTTKDTPASREALTAAGLTDYKSGHWSFFTFADSDKVLGSLAVETSADSQTIKFNAINYHLWFGGKKYLPFQLYLGQTQSKDPGSATSAATNTVQLVDPEAGVALKFPAVWTYQSEGDGFCAFLSDASSIGHCSVGGDLTLSVKDLKNAAGETESTYGTTLRLGGAVLFPILSDDKKTTKGYLSMAARLVVARTNVDDSTQLFAPVIDASGNPVKFKGTIASTDLEVKWKFHDTLAIGARWFRPLNNKDYLDSQFKLALETQF